MHNNLVALIAATRPERRPSSWQKQQQQQPPLSPPLSLPETPESAASPEETVPVTSAVTTTIPPPIDQQRNENYAPPRAVSFEEPMQSERLSAPVVYAHKVATPGYVTSAIDRALAFHNNGHNFLKKGENYSALLNFALVANTLTELKNYAADDDVLENVRIPSDLCSSGYCGSVDDALQHALSMVVCLQKRVVEIRSGQIELIEPVVAASAASTTLPPVVAEATAEATAEDEENSVGGGGGGGRRTAMPAFANDVEQTPEQEEDFFEGGGGAKKKKSSVSIMNWTEKLCRENCFERLIGNDDAKQRITDLFVSPLLYPNMYGKMGKGLLLYGPPGTGKTALARAMVSEIHKRSGGAIEVILLTPQGQDFKSKYFGESERQIKELFETASRLACDAQLEHDSRSNSSSSGSGSGSGNAAAGEAKQIKRVISIIFIDEIDSIAESRDSSGDESSGSSSKSTVNALLQQMDGISSFSNVAVIGATNFPKKIDLAVKRRLSQEIYVKLPSKKDIEQMIYLNINKMITDVVLPEDIENAGKECSAGKNKDGGPGSGSGGYSCSQKDYAACADLKDLDLWKQYKDVYFSTLFSEQTKIEAAALELEKLMYSASDVNEFFSRCLRRAAEIALQNNIFIVGPIMGKTKDMKLGSERRGFISIAGMASKDEGPFSPLKSIQDKVFSFEKEKLVNANGDVGEYFNTLSNSPDAKLRRKLPGTIVIGPAKYSSFIEKVRIREVDEAVVTDFVNISAQGSTKIDFTISLAYYIPDFLIDEVFVEYDQDNNKQLSNRVLFNIAIPIIQGPVEEGHVGNCMDREGFDEMPSMLIRQKMDNESKSKEDIVKFIEMYYCPEKRDFVNLFASVYISDLKVSYFSDKDKKTIRPTKEFLEEVFKSENTEFFTNIHGKDIVFAPLQYDNVDKSGLIKMIQYHSEINGEGQKYVDDMKKYENDLVGYLAHLKSSGLMVSKMVMGSVLANPFLEQTDDYKVIGSITLSAPYRGVASGAGGALAEQHIIDIVYNTHFLNWGVTGEIVASEAAKGVKSMSSTKEVIDEIQKYANENPAEGTNTWRTSIYNYGTGIAKALIGQ